MALAASSPFEEWLMKTFAPNRRFRKGKSARRLDEVLLICLYKCCGGARLSRIVPGAFDAIHCPSPSVKINIVSNAAMHSSLPSWVNICRAISRNARLLYPIKLPRQLFAVEAVTGHKRTLALQQNRRDSTGQLAASTETVE
jgi:hypothetical protein